MNMSSIFLTIDKYVWSFLEMINMYQFLQTYDTYFYPISSEKMKRQELSPNIMGWWKDICGGPLLDQENKYDDNWMRNWREW